MRDDPTATHNGISTHVRELTKALEKRGHEVKWFIGATDRGAVKLGGSIPPDFDLVEAMSLHYGAKVRLPMVARCNSPLKEEGKYYRGFKKLKG